MYKAVVVYNPVFAVLYLILAFLGIAALLIFLSADYLAVLFVLIYGGAISILIMFVVMMLDLKEMEVRVPAFSYFVRYLCLVTTFGMLLLFATTKDVEAYKPKNLEYVNWYEVARLKTNIEVVGTVLYTQYNFYFLVMGFLLFLSMVVIISLVIRKNTKVKNQRVADQLRASNEKMFFSK